MAAHDQGSASMMETVDQLCRTLAREQITVAEAAQAIGAIEEDRGGYWPVRVRPANPALAQARVVRKGRTEEPAYVELDLGGMGGGGPTLSVRDLVAAFGPYREAALQPLDDGEEIVFRYDAPAMPRTCALIATVMPASRGGFADGTITRLTVRRDIRLA